MQRFYETVIDTLTGAAVSGAQVWVLHPDGSMAALWQDALATVPAANPMISDGNGFVACYAADGIYTLDFRANGVSLRSVEGVPIFDLLDMRADVDGLLATMPLKAAITYVDAADAAISATLAALDADVYRKASVYTKAQVDAAIAAVPRYYSFGAFAPASIQASEILMDHIVAVDCTLAANFANLQASVGTPPAATWTADVQKNGASIGSIAIANTGVVTKSTVGGTAKPLVTGDVVTVVGDAVVQAAMARLRFTFRGTI